MRTPIKKRFVAICLSLIGVPILGALAAYSILAWNFRSTTPKRPFDSEAPVEVQLHSDRPFHEVIIPFVAPDKKDSDQNPTDIFLPLTSKSINWSAKLDTGSEEITLPPETRPQLNGRIRSSYTMPIYSIETVGTTEIVEHPTEITKAGNFSIGNLELKNPALSIEHDIKGEIPPGKKPVHRSHVIIGNSAFRNTILTIDYPARKLHVFDPHYLLPPPAKGVTRASLKFRGRFVYDEKYPEHILTTGQLKGKPVNIYIDTGSAGGAISSDLFDLYKSRFKTDKIEIGTWSLHGVADRLNGLNGQIGSFTFTGDFAVFGSEGLGKNTILIGSSLLKHFRVTIDYGRQTLYLDLPPAQ